MAFTATVGQKEPGPEAAGAISKGPSSSAYSAAYTAGPANAFGPGRDSSPMHRHVLSHQAEKPQPHHFALGEGPKPSTHDFLSLYDKSSQHLQHGSGPVLSSSLTTQDFLQPLERGGARQAYGEASLPRIDKSVRGKAVQSHPAAPAPMERLLPTVIPNYATVQVPYRRTAGVMELPPNSAIRMIGEANDEAMRSRGYAGGAQFTREDQNATGSDEGALDPESVTNARENLAYWSSVRLKFGLPQDLKFLANNSPAASENGGQVTAKQWTQRNECMIEVPKRPSRGPSEDDEDEDEDSQERASGNRKISRFQKEDASQKADMKSSEIRAGTPRSKHSATEQRRRSKINDRFQMLRDLVPHSDQKRDKASFLLEVIEYIQILQDKVQKYETVEQGRHQERLKSMVWDLCKRGTGSGEEASQINALVFAKEFSPGGLPLDVKQVTEVATEMTRSRGSFLSDHVSPSEPTTGAPKVQHPSRPASSIHSCVSSLEEKESTALVAQPVAVAQVPAQQAIPPAFCRTPVQPKQQYEHISSRGAPLANSSENDNPGDLDASHFRVNGYVSGQGPGSSPDHHQFEARFRSSPSRQAEQVSQGPLSKVQLHPQLANVISRVDEAQTGVGSGSSPLRSPHEDGSGSLGTGQSQKQLGVSSSDHVSGREGAPTSPHAPLKIQGGVINVSTAYSKGLLDTLTRALQSSGLDLAQANISVQIDLGKNSISADVDTSAKIATTPESSAQSHQSQGRTRPPPPVTESEPVLKKPKVEAGQ